MSTYRLSGTACSIGKGVKSREAEFSAPFRCKITGWFPSSASVDQSVGDFLSLSDRNASHHRSSESGAGRILIKHRANGSQKRPAQLSYSHERSTNSHQPVALHRPKAGKLGYEPSRAYAPVLAWISEISLVTATAFLRRSTGVQVVSQV